MVADVVRGDSIHNSLHLLSIAVIVEVGRRRARNRNQPVLRVVGEIVGLSVHHARGHVSVGIVGIGISIREGRDGVLVVGVVGGVIHAVLAGEVARASFVAVALGIDSIRSAGDVGIRQPVESVAIADVPYITWEN